MPAITITKLYELVSIKPGRETAENLTTFIEEKISCEVDTKTSILATKEDLAREIGCTKADLTREIGITNAKIETTKAELIKWMFLFWIGQVITTFGFILLFINK
ncbi:hypothetical protein [Longitalea luteola]|uniref:hypothetical protein n=1 Tax=Longitalea luteola TaxID=2812563 RepID=UPI001A9671F8|nr:hypothetical protein [Longitalea luteola]